MSSTVASALELVVSLEDFPPPLRGPGERVQHSALQSPFSTRARSCDLLAIEFELFVMKMESNATFDSKTPKFMISQLIEW